MKTDVLTVAAIVFVVGMLASTLGITDVFENEVAEPQAPLHQGVIVAKSN